MRLPVYSIETAVFEMFPAFRRGVVIATGIDNHGSDPEIARMLAESVRRVTPVPTAKEQERFSVWNNAYRRFGADPDRHTPSVRFLYEQIRKGKPLRSINKLVDVMNLTSTRLTVPCGGDDLESLDGGDVCLGFARGDETFAPLFKPASVESPEVGEVIYYTPQTRKVMCRRWTWRNADFSRLKPETTAVAINIDMMMPPFQEPGLEDALANVTQLLQRFCQGKIQTHIFSPTNAKLQIEGNFWGRGSHEDLRVAVH